MIGANLLCYLLCYIVVHIHWSNLDSILKSKDITLPTKVHLAKAIGFFSSHVWMWELDYKKSWAPKNWCFWTVVLEKTLDSPLDCKKIQPVHPKEDQSWVFIGRTDAEAETPVLWRPHAKSWLIVKDPDARRDWGQEEKGIENEMAGWYHRLVGHEFVWTQGVGDGQGHLACCNSWGRKDSDMTERQTELNWSRFSHAHWSIFRQPIHPLLSLSLWVLQAMQFFYLLLSYSHQS